MSSPRPHQLCPICHAPLNGVQARAEETITRLADKVVIGAQRVFVGVCPVHERVRSKILGHHSTLSKAHMRHRFTKAQRARIAAALGAENLRRFKDAMTGWCLPSDEELAIWHRLAVDRPDGDSRSAPDE